MRMCGLPLVALATGAAQSIRSQSTQGVKLSVSDQSRQEPAHDGSLARDWLSASAEHPAEQVAPIANPGARMRDPPQSREGR
jgi:hypothetical protein